LFPKIVHLFIFIYSNTEKDEELFFISCLAIA